MSSTIIQPHTEISFDILPFESDGFLSVFATKNTTKKAAIFVDYENVQIGFDDTTAGIKGVSIDFGEMSRLLPENKEVSWKKAYSARTRNSPVPDAIRTIGKAGFELILEDCPRNVQKGVDVRIGMEIESCLNDKSCDTIILVSGDADFIPAVERAHEKGFIVVVASFANSLSRGLARLADKVVLLDKLRMVDLDPRAIKNPNENR